MFEVFKLAVLYTAKYYLRITEAVASATKMMAFHLVNSVEKFNCIYRHNSIIFITLITV